jgi:hypothetical protein
VIEDARELTLQHHRMVAAFPGFWEIRALQRSDSNRMLYRGSFYVVVTQAGEDLIYDRLGNETGR